MNDETTSAEGENTESADSAEDTGLNLAKLQKEVFQPAQIEKGMERITAVVVAAQENAVAVNYNFDPEEELPEGYALCVVPIKQRSEGATEGNKLVSIAIGAFPSLATVANHANGETALSDMLADTCTTLIASAFRPKKGGAASSVPFTIDDFLLGRIALSREAFKTLSDGYVAGLKGKGIKGITRANLEKALESAVFASAMFASYNEEMWPLVLDKMIAKAEADGLNPGIMNHWKHTRNNTVVDSGTIDLDDLADL